jgi:hypothetical protein
MFDIEQIDVRFCTPYNKERTAYAILSKSIKIKITIRILMRLLDLI